MKGTSFEITDLLERTATDQARTEGYDIADYLIRFPWREPTVLEKNNSMKKKQLTGRKIKGQRR